MGLTLKLFQARVCKKFGVFLWQNQKKWVPIFGKIPRYGYLFLEKVLLDMGMGSE